jgi:thiol:disulfide interchange protein
MMSLIKKALPLFLILVAALPALSQAQAPIPKTTAATAGPFDPTRDSVKELQQATAEASKSGKRILLDVGGNWCVWCWEMEKFVEEHKELRQLRDRNFVVVMVNYSSENENKALLSRYPQINSYPHLFVLDSDSKLLHSQDTSELELGESYDLEKYTAFLTEWAPPQK